MTLVSDAASKIVSSVIGDFDGTSDFDPYRLLINDVAVVADTHDRAWNQSGLNGRLDLRVDLRAAAERLRRCGGSSTTS